MKKTTKLWLVSDLSKTFARINFPEFQREPTVWKKDAKQRLIDSIIREFDIASLYLYVDEDGSIDCIDGRQRIGAIMSFLGQNPEDADNGFVFKVLNEIYTDTDHPFQTLSDRTLEQVREGANGGDPYAQAFLATLDRYELTVVSLSGSRKPEEFNLQFARLNLGTIINSGEKLHAMVGELRNACFDEIGTHPFLEKAKIPTRRYAREQTAAQILAQIFSLDASDEFTRTRHFDLQRLFKEYSTLPDEKRALIQRTRALLDLLHGGFPTGGNLRNRSITVSTVLLAWEIELADHATATRLAQFLDEFLCRLKWQVAKDLDVDPEYRYLIDFQRHLTQASVEKPAVEERARVLREEYDRWSNGGLLRGDAVYQQRTSTNPAVACRAPIP